MAKKTKSNQTPQSSPAPVFNIDDLLPVQEEPDTSSNTTPEPASYFDGTWAYRNPNAISGFAVAPSQVRIIEQRRGVDHQYLVAAVKAPSWCGWVDGVQRQ